MKNTNRILAALLVVIILLMSLTAITVCAEEAQSAETGNQTSDGGEASVEQGGGIAIDDNTVVIAICIAIAAIGMMFATVCLVRKPKVKPWWQV